MNEAGWQIQRTRRRNDRVGTNSQPMVRPTATQNSGLKTNSSPAQTKRPRRNKGKLGPGVMYRVEGKFDPFAEAERRIAERLRKEEDHVS